MEWGLDDFDFGEVGNSSTSEFRSLIDHFKLWKHRSWSMSCRKGGTHDRKPVHQNTFAFRHNLKSKKTEKILASPVKGVCQRCIEQIVSAILKRHLSPAKYYAT